MTGILLGCWIGLTPAAANAATPIGDQPPARALLDQLISYRTAKGQGQVPAMAEMLVARLRAAGFADEDLVRVPVTVEGEKTEGLLVRFRAHPGATKRPVALLAHMDVVDAVAANWHTDPFKPTEQDGYLYGRGSLDNKFAVALLITTFERLKRAGYTPDRDIVLALCGDEETGMLTSRAMLAHPFLSHLDFALNADAGGGSRNDAGAPLEFTLQAAEKTSANFTLTTHNSGGHSALPRADNALYQLAHALVAVEALHFPVEFNEINRAMIERLSDRTTGEVTAALKTILHDPTDRASIAIIARRPEIAGFLWTTCVGTMAKAGNAPNALPQNASATINCRIMPGDSAEQIRSTLARAINDSNVQVALDGEAVESPASPIRADILDLLAHGVQANYPGFVPTPTMSMGGTEGREYRRSGIPTYGAGSILKTPGDNRAHGVDERLPLDSFYKEVAYWDVVIHLLGGPGGESPRG
ncbi:M20/M25/M40 family metallo-hydrolase [Sphingomonas sp.]|uniref:M20/M25/M40 family metallo-hydrolase n=1 Tax=Sphingomonas sp. TaxID=28214 RepID=UPI0025F02170|nr:M20/M25/M40 family metallo-hydrolase [Sphingomonas sp.]